jgi:hypothetical protein
MLSNEKARPEISCAERAEEDPQNLLINRMAATAILEYVYKFFYQRSIDSFISEFNSKTGEIHKKYITRKNIKDTYIKAYPNHPKVKALIDF